MKSDKMAEIGLSRRHKMSHHYLSTPIINQVSNNVIHLANILPWGYKYKEIKAAV